MGEIRSKKSPRTEKSLHFCLSNVFQGTLSLSPAAAKGVITASSAFSVFPFVPARYPSSLSPLLFFAKLTGTRKKREKDEAKNPQFWDATDSLTLEKSDVYRLLQKSN